MNPIGTVRHLEGARRDAGRDEAGRKAHGRAVSRCEARVATVRWSLAGSGAAGLGSYGAAHFARHGGTGTRRQGAGRPVLSCGQGVGPRTRGFMTIWLGIFIGSTIGGLIPELWDASMFSYASVLFGGIGALAGLWIGLKLGN
jgi:hypothetical protein